MTILEKRNSLGLSQKDFAKILNIGEKRYRKYEKKSTECPEEILKKIMDFNDTENNINKQGDKDQRNINQTDNNNQNKKEIQEVNGFLLPKIGKDKWEIERASNNKKRCLGNYGKEEWKEYVSEFRKLNSQSSKNDDFCTVYLEEPNQEAMNKYINIISKINVKSTDMFMDREKTLLGFYKDIPIEVVIDIFKKDCECVWITVHWEDKEILK